MGRRLVWIVLAAGFAVRIAFLFYSQKSPYYEPLILDPAYYHDWAVRLIQGHPPREVFYGLPLYPYFLALAYKISAGSLEAVKALQLVLGTASLYFIYRIGERTASRGTGLLAAAMAAVYGPAFFHETMLVPEALAVPLYAAALFAALVFDERPDVRKGLVLGVLMGLAALTKAGILVFAFLFLVWVSVRRRTEPGRKLGPVFACGLALLLTLTPVTAHNWIRGGDFVLLTSHSGLNFYIGNNPRAEGIFAAPEGVGGNVEAQREDSRLIAERASGRKLKPSEVSAYWSGKAWDFIRGEPGRFFELCVKKLFLFFDAREISDVEDYAFAKTFNPFLKLPWMTFAALGPLFFAGVALSGSRLRQKGILFLWIGSYLAGILLFFVNARYRLPVLSAFFPVAAAGLCGGLDAWREKAKGRLLLLGLALAAGIGITQMKLVGNDWLNDHINVGDIYQKKLDYGRAEQAYREALKIDPSSAKANLALGLVLTKTGRMEESREYYVRSLEADPENFQPLNNLGMWHDAAGDFDKAEEYFLRALKVRPDSYLGHNNLGMIYGKMGRNAEAKREFETALKLNPEYARALVNLGLIYYREGDLAKARRLWEEAREIDPGFAEAQRALSLLRGKR